MSSSFSPNHSTCLNTKSVQASLLSKYQNQFAFYRVKPINEMLYGQGRKNYIDLNDIRIFIDRGQFLRRVYYYRTSMGKEELLLRMQMCQDFYGKQIMMGCEYPTMIINNQQNLFQRRYKKLKKIVNGELQSEIEEGNDEEQNFFMRFFGQEQRDILAQLDQMSFNEPEDVEQYQCAFDDEYYNLYEEPEDEQEDISETFQVLKLKDIDEKEIEHLIVDMQSLKVTELKQSTKIEQPPLALKNIENKQTTTAKPQFSLQNTPLESFEYPEPSFQYIRPSFPKFAPSSVNFARLSSSTNLRQHFSETYKAIKQSTTFQTQLGELKKSEDKGSLGENRRKKIREKAQELLKRVKKNQFSDQCF